MATDKQAWLERLGVAASWPMSGKPAELYLDNAAEFKSEALWSWIARRGRLGLGEDLHAAGET